MSNPLNNVLDKIDAINATDPNMERVDDQEQPKELVYGQRMSAALQAYGEASELLQIAARAQHIKRWAIPRKDYPMDRKGYLKWRTQLKIFHGNLIAEIMGSEGYTENQIKRVKDLLMKKNLQTDTEVQILEDVICLVFLHYYIDAFAIGKTEEKLIDILKKTWIKMSEKGHTLAQKLPLSVTVQSLLQKALVS
jgi:hypothetical protein